MGRAPCCSKVGLRRGPWSIKEDTILTNYIQEHGEGQWRSLPKNAGLLRCGKSCRLRWMNYLRPGIKRGNIGQDEEDLIVRLHGLLGNRWSLIAGRLPGRTDNEIKNYWNTHLIKKLAKTSELAAAPASAPVAAKNPKPPKDSSKAPKSKKPSSTRKKKGKKVNESNNPTDDKLVDDKAASLEMEIKSQQPANHNEDGDKSEEDAAAPVKTKVYLPKPIRVSSVFSRTSSYDSLASGASSSNEAGTGVPAAMEVASYVPVAWPPLFEMEDGGVSGGDFLGCIMPVMHQEPSDSMSSDVDMWERVYDEYFQLL